MPAASYRAATRTSPPARPDGRCESPRSILAARARCPATALPPPCRPRQPRRRDPPPIRAAVAPTLPRRPRPTPRSAAHDRLRHAPAAAAAAPGNPRQRSEQHHPRRPRHRAPEPLTHRRPDRPRRLARDPPPAASKRPRQRTDPLPGDAVAQRAQMAASRQHTRPRVLEPHMALAGEPRANLLARRTIWLRVRRLSTGRQAAPR